MFKGHWRAPHETIYMVTTYPLGYFMLHFIMFLIRQMTTKASNEAPWKQCAISWSCGLYPESIAFLQVKSLIWQHMYDIMLIPYTYVDLPSWELYAILYTVFKIEKLCISRQHLKERHSNVTVFMARLFRGSLSVFIRIYALIIHFLVFTITQWGSRSTYSNYV